MEYAESRKNTMHCVSQVEFKMVAQMDLVQTLNQERLRSLNLMADLLCSYAPTPGALVYIDTQQLLEPWQDFYPTIFTAFDVATHLQAGNIYLLRNTASAVDFLRVVRASFPFRIREVRTPDSDLFTSPTLTSSTHIFTQVATSQGIVHSLLSKESSDPILALTLLYGMDGMLRKQLKELEANEIVGDFVEYLSFHNNDRPLPTLKGLTPIQKLRTYPEYSGIMRLEPQLQ